MKSTVGKALVIVLLLAVVGGMAAWLLFGDDIAQSLAGEPQSTPPCIRL